MLSWCQGILAPPWEAWFLTPSREGAVCLGDALSLFPLGLQWDSYILYSVCVRNLSVAGGLPMVHKLFLSYFLFPCYYLITLYLVLMVWPMRRVWKACSVLSQRRVLHLLQRALNSFHQTRFFLIVTTLLLWNGGKSSVSSCHEWMDESSWSLSPSLLGKKKKKASEQHSTPSFFKSYLA